MGHPQLLWATCARASPPGVTKVLPQDGFGGGQDAHQPPGPAPGRVPEPSRLMPWLWGWSAHLAAQQWDVMGLSWGCAGPGAPQLPWGELFNREMTLPWLLYVPHKD